MTLTVDDELEVRLSNFERLDKYIKIVDLVVSRLKLRLLSTNNRDSILEYLDTLEEDMKPIPEYHDILDELSIIEKQTKVTKT